MQAELFLLLLMAIVGLILTIKSLDDLREQKRKEEQRLLELYSYFIPCYQCKHAGVCGKKKRFQRDLKRFYKAKRSSVTVIGVKCAAFRDIRRTETKEERNVEETKES